MATATAAAASDDLGHYTILVTGGTRGIGRGAALAFAQRFGDRVTLVLNYASNDEEARATVAEVAALAGGKQPALIKADLRAEAECERLIQEAVAQGGGRLDCIVLNHGIAVDHDIGDTSMDFATWTKIMKDTMNCNFNSAAELSCLAVRQFLAQKQKPDAFSKKRAGIDRADGCNGRLVHITSRAAVRGELTAPGYAASKAALSIFGQSLARRFAPDGIISFCVAPGWVKTAMAAAVLTGPGASEVLAQHPLGRVAEVAEVADTIVFCAVDAPLAMTGTVIDINGASYLSS